MSKAILTVLAASVLAASAQTTINGNRSITGAWDASAATSTKPVKTGTADPATCALGEMFYRTDSNTLKFCSATNVWTAGGGNYVLPAATASVLGGVKVGSGLTVDGSGVLNVAASSAPAPQETNPRYFIFKDDFPSLAGFSGNTTVQAQQRWGTTGCASGSGDTSNTAGGTNWGLVKLLTGTTSGTGCALYSPTGVEALPGLHHTGMDVYVVFKYLAASDYANSALQIGYYTYSAAAIGRRALGLRFDTSAGDTGTFRYYYTLESESSYGGAVDSGVSVDANYHVFRLRSDATESGKFYLSLDGGTEKTFCSAGCDMNHGGAFNLTAGRAFKARLAPLEAAAKNLILDYVSIYVPLGAADGRRN